MKYGKGLFIAFELVCFVVFIVFLVRMMKEKKKKDTIHDDTPKKMDTDEIVFTVFIVLFICAIPVAWVFGILNE